MHSGENLPVIISRFILSLTITKQRPFCQHGVFDGVPDISPVIALLELQGKDAEKEIAF